VPAGDSAGASAGPATLTEDAKSYLRYGFQVECAEDYLVYPDGEGPPVPNRSESEWSEREAELRGCLEEKVLGRHTSLERVQVMMWNGKDYTMSQGAMRTIVRDGDAYLDDYVDSLIAGERRRAGSSPDGPLPREGDASE